VTARDRNEFELRELDAEYARIGVRAANSIFAEMICRPGLGNSEICCLFNSLKKDAERRLELRSEPRRKLSAFTVITPLFGVVASYVIMHDELTRRLAQVLCCNCRTFSR
jgi:hypothetical protein